MTLPHTDQSDEYVDGPRLWITQHIGWLKMYAEGMDETNWRDMQLLIQRQLRELTRDWKAYERR